jgi:hypothetical protein
MTLAARPSTGGSDGHASSHGRPSVVLLVCTKLRVEPESEAHLCAVLECLDLVRLTPQVSVALHDALTRHYGYVDVLLANEES